MNLDPKKSLYPPPASANLLGKVAEKVIAPTIAGVNTTVITFAGSGLHSCMKYIAGHPDTNKETEVIFAPLDINRILRLPEQSLGYMFSTLKNNYSVGTKTLWNKIFENINLAKPTQNDLYTLITNFKTLNQRIVFIVTGVDKLIDSQEQKYNAESLLSLIRSSNSKLTNFIFLIQGEIHKDNALKFESYNQFRVFGKELLFDKVDMEQIFKTQDPMQKLQITETQKNELIQMFLHDPAALKHMISVLKIENFDNLEDLDKEWFKSRFDSIFGRLSKASLDFLEFPEANSPSEYLGQSGILQENGIILNTFTTTFFKQNSKNYKTHKQATELDKVLSGTQYLIYKKLEKNLEELVSREELAQVVWGANWEKDFTDNALDKHISNLNKKIAHFKNLGHVKGMKGKGYILTGKI